jgi:RsiW-degrading membrane proteinase PrsW (M82 family)
VTGKASRGGHTGCGCARMWLRGFLVPVTFVAWAFERRGTGELTAGLVFSTFLTGGVEEAVKLLALMVLTRHLQTRSLRDGLILGAAVGFGFAVFESAEAVLRALIETCREGYEEHGKHAPETKPA